MFDLKSKVLFLVIYFLLCSIIAHINLIINENYYYKILQPFKLSITAIKYILDLRGINYDHINEKAELVKLITDTGDLYEAELNNYKEIVDNGQVKSIEFNTVTEFFETIEDETSIWLVQIRYENKDNYINEVKWNELVNKLSKFGIRTGKFLCTNHNKLCKQNNWHKSQLILALPNKQHYQQSKSPSNSTSQSSINLYNYDGIYKYEYIIKWLKKSIIELNAKIEKINKTSELYQLNNELFAITYILASKESADVPLYYLATSVKYNGKVKFQIQNQLDYKYCFKNDEIINKSSPIYIISNEYQLCYNYGINLNELPNYLNLNFHLHILYPTINTLFLINLFIINLLLFMHFFKYNAQSMTRQVLLSIIYVLKYNFCLFILWVFIYLTISNIEIRVNKYTNMFNLVVFYGNYTNSTINNVHSYLKFYLFFYINMNNLRILTGCYIITCLLYYFYTRKLYFNDYADDNNDTWLTTIIPSLSANNTITNDIDLEIGINIINQINGMTSLWLHSTTFADRLMQELTTIIYCKCFESNVQHHLTCKCGKNSENVQILSSTLKSVVSYECPICLEHYKLNDKISQLTICHHNFHHKCIYEWFLTGNYRCPLCRTLAYRFTVTYVNKDS